MAKIYSILKQFSVAHSAFLLNYLFFQMELVARFPPSEVENLTVWQHILLRALSQDVRLRVELDIIDLAKKVLTDWENGGYRLGQVDQVVSETFNVRCIMTVATPYIEVFVLP